MTLIDNELHHTTPGNHALSRVGYTNWIQAASLYSWMRPPRRSRRVTSGEVLAG
jgi:hypothetical protein